MLKSQFLRRWDIARTWVFGETGRGGYKTYINVNAKKSDVRSSSWRIGDSAWAWQPQAARTFFEIYWSYDG